MSKPGGFMCPFCRQYNARDARHCGRCERLLPPSWLAGPLRNLGTVDLWATKLLAGTSILVFALEMASAGGASLNVLTSLPASVLFRFGALANGLPTSEPWRLLAACFVHMGVLHVAMNLLALAELGRVGEPLVKGSRFLITYVVTGIAGFLVSALWYGTRPYLTAGASGAIFGLDGLILGGLLARRDPAWKSMLSRTLVHSFLFYFALGGATNQAAHLGGLAAGLGLGFLFGQEKRPWRRDAAAHMLAAAGLVAIIGSLVLSQVSPVWRSVRAAETRRTGGGE